MITCDDLENAMLSVEHSESPTDLGIDFDALEEFFEQTVFHHPESGAEITMDGLSMILGIAIGIIAGRLESAS